MRLAAAALVSGLPDRYGSQENYTVARSQYCLQYRSINEPARSGLTINRAAVKSLALCLAARPLGQRGGGHRLHCSRGLGVAQQLGCCGGDTSRCLLIGGLLGCQSGYLSKFMCKKAAGALFSRHLPPMFRRIVPSGLGVSASVCKHVPGVHTGNGRMPAQKRSSNGRRSCQLLFEE